MTAYTRSVPFLAPHFLTVCLLAGLTACLNPGKGKTAFVGGTIIDGSGAPPILDGVIIVADGHIDEIGPPDLVDVPRGAVEIRVDGKWVIPGLIDAHVHAERWALTRYLAYGITSIRSMGGDRDSVAALRQSSLNGTLIGPRVFISGPTIDGRPATRPGATEVGSPEAARRAVDDRVLLGASAVKVYTKVDRRLLGPLIDEANALQMPVAAHLGKVDAVTAATMGVHSIEHMSGVVEAALADPSRLYRAHNDFFTAPPPGHPAHQLPTPRRPAGRHPGSAQGPRSDRCGTRTDACSARGVRPPGRRTVHIATGLKRGTPERPRCMGRP